MKTTKQLKKEIEKKKEIGELLDKISEYNRKFDGRANFIEGYNRAIKNCLKEIDERIKYYKDYKEAGFHNQASSIIKALEELKTKLGGE